MFTTNSTKHCARYWGLKNDQDSLFISEFTALEEDTAEDGLKLHMKGS